jgi:FKBP-type peptidyl-prolyl cis-trans isomerase
MRLLSWTAAAALAGIALAGAGCDGGAHLTTSPSGLKFVDLKEGEGPAAKVGDVVDYHFTGTAASGKRFRSSYDNLRPERIKLGRGLVIAGVDEGLVGMKPGGKRRLIIPSYLAFGSLGSPPDVPANMDVVYEVELVAVNPPAPAFADAEKAHAKLPERPALTDEEKARAVTTPSGLQYIDLQPGEGREARRGDNVQVQYTGWLTNGAKFDSSLDRGQPYTLKLSPGSGVIQGWVEGVAGMKIGGKRKLIIPPALAYGEKGNVAIPPNATLVFEVELLRVQ